MNRNHTKRVVIGNINEVVKKVNIDLFIVFPYRRCGWGRVWVRGYVIKLKRKKQPIYIEREKERCTKVVKGLQGEKVAPKYYIYLCFNFILYRPPLPTRALSWAVRINHHFANSVLFYLCVYLSFVGGTCVGAFYLYVPTPYGMEFYSCALAQGLRAFAPYAPLHATTGFVRGPSRREPDAG